MPRISKCKQCRRENEKLFIKGDRCYSPKCALIKKPYAPGAHGPKSQFRLSDYAKQLREKQKAKRFYQLREQQYRNYYDTASKQEGNTAELFWQLLESRLDSVLRRAQVSKSIIAVRQIVSHGKTKVNGKKVDIPSYQLKVGDEITINPDVPVNYDQKVALPNWISFDAKKKTFKFQGTPVAEDGDAPYNMNLVIEYYSK